MVTIEKRNTCSLVRAAMTPREKNMEQAFGHDLILVKIASEENTKSLAESLVIRSTASVLGSSVKEGLQAKHNMPMIKFVFCKGYKVGGVSEPSFAASSCKEIFKLSEGAKELSPK